MKQYTIDQLNDLLNRACEIITSLEGFIELKGNGYYSSDLSKSVDNLFNEIDFMNEEDTGPEYDSAGFTEEDRIVEGQYMNMYKDTDPDLVQLERDEDPNWLFPGEPLHDDDPEEIDAAYEKYVETVKRNIDKAVQEGILRDDCTEGYSYMCKETWLNTQADQEAQDHDVFGENKI